MGTRCGRTFASVQPESSTAVCIVGSCRQLTAQPLTVSHPEVVETADLKLGRDDDVAAASWIKPRLTGALAP